MYTRRGLLPIFAITSLLVTFLGVAPFAAIAQVTLKSANFEINGANFGTNYTLITAQNNPPAISTDGPALKELSYNRAVIVWKTDKKSTSTVEFGVTESLGLEATLTELVTDHEVTLSGLGQQTKYYYRVKSIDAFGAPSFSDVKTFTTPDEPGINTIFITNISYTEAFIGWKTGLFTQARIEYGLDRSYGLQKTTSSLSFSTDHLVQLTDLTPGTQYHFRIIATDENGNEALSNDIAFETIPEPKFDSITVTDVTDNAATIQWKTNVFTTGILTYKSDKDQNAQSAGDSTLTDTHALVLQNLYGLTEYTFEITATDKQGKQVKSGTRTFTTISDNTPPTISNLKVNVTRAGDDLVLTLKCSTGEPATLLVSYYPKTDKEQVTKIPQQGAFLTDHIIISTGLVPSTPYALTVVASDAFGNSTEQVINFVSPALKKSILQLILDSISGPLGWIGQIFGS